MGLRVPVCDLVSLSATLPGFRVWGCRFSCAAGALRRPDTMTTVALGHGNTQESLDVEDATAQPCLLDALAKHCFGLEAEEPLSLDAAQNAEVAKLLEWAAQVLGSDCCNALVSPTRARVAAGEQRGVPLLDTEWQTCLEPALKGVREAMSMLRDFKLLESKAQSMVQAVSQRAEDMHAKLSNTLKRGELAEGSLLQKAKVVDDWLMQKKGEIEQQLSAAESEALGKVECGATLLLNAWLSLSPQPEQLAPIPEGPRDMEVDLSADDMLAELNAGLPDAPATIVLGVEQDFATTGSVLGFRVEVLGSRV